MKRVFLIVYLLSLCIAIVAFVLCNILTVSPEQVSGNGNPSLFFFFSSIPFLLIFLYGTMKFLMAFMGQKLNKKEIIMVTIICFCSGVFIYISTIVKAHFFRYTIVKFNPSYENINQIPYVNIHSNFLFFNASTFMMLILFVAFIGGIWVLKNHRKNKKQGKVE